MFNIGPQELILVLAVALIVVGPKRLPEMARLLGRGLNELRKVQDEVRDMVKFDLTDDQGEPFITPPPHHARVAAPDEQVEATSNGHGTIAAEAEEADTEPFEADDLPPPTAPG